LGKLTQLIEQVGKVDAVTAAAPALARFKRQGRVKIANPITGQDEWQQIDPAAANYYQQQAQLVADAASKNKEPENLPADIFADVDDGPGGTGQARHLVAGLPPTDPRAAKVARAIASTLKISPGKLNQIHNDNPDAMANMVQTLRTLKSAVDFETGRTGADSLDDSAITADVIKGHLHDAGYEVTREQAQALKTNVKLINNSTRIGFAIP
jgi:hypothetical protein